MPGRAIPGRVPWAEMPMTVLSHPRFRGNLDELTSAGIEVKLVDDFSDLVLAHPGPGEIVVGDLLPEERSTYAELMRQHIELERLSREYLGAAIERQGQALRTSDVNKPFSQVMSAGEMTMLFPDEASKLAYFRVQQRGAAIHGVFYWQLGERLGLHHWSIGVRHGFKVVKVAPRL